MDLPVLPILAVCHRRHHRVHGGTYFYTYGLLAFPGPGVARQRAPFCIALRRRWEPDHDSADAKPGSDFLAVSEVFRVPSQAAMNVFERIAFAGDPVSPHHLVDLVNDLLLTDVNWQETATLALAVGS